MNSNRRAFLGQFSATLGAMMLPASILSSIRSVSSAASGKRRHLINLIGAGGWDSSWFHTYFSQSELVGLSEARISQSRGGFETDEFNKGGLLYSQKCSDESEAQKVIHPLDPRHAMGPGMGLIFDSADYSDFLIWKGLIPAGGHTFGNNLILQGNSSSYSVSFSGLVASGLDLERRRPLHYVMMANNPGELFSNAAMQSGPSIPICIANVDQFKSMTQLDPKDFSNKDLRNRIARSIKNLGSVALRGTAQLEDTKAKVDGMSAAFAGANTIYGSNFAETPEFKYLHKRYFMAMVRAFKNVLNDRSNMMARATALPRLHPYYGWPEVFSGLGGLAQKLAPLPAWTDFIKSPSAYAAQLSDIHGDPSQLLGSNYYASGGELGIMLNQAYSYAFADYLVRYDLSAVVDIPAWPGLVDAHSNYMGEFCSMLRTFACFRELMHSLKEISLPDQGGNLLDATLIALHSEFDREPWHQPRHWSAPQTVANAGTNHGNTASIILAGYGINRGKVVGGMNLGPKNFRDFPGTYTSPVPIDLGSGDIFKGGTQVSTLAIFPTILGIFGFNVPLQQITDWSAISAVVKRGAF